MPPKKSIRLTLIFLIFISGFNTFAYFANAQLPERNTAFSSLDRAIKGCLERGQIVLSGQVYESRPANKFIFVCSDYTTVERYYQGTQDIILMGGTIVNIEETPQGTRLIISYTYKIGTTVQEIYFHLYPKVVLGKYPTSGGNTVNCQMWSGFRGANSINTLLCGG
ncbi:MAG: hypothetical protein D6732_17080 [Methanobacteriota archaeon]|nr:MAG: hypothetical protein D6732_17080 [Euryarchaeota archaeon]